MEKKNLGLVLGDFTTLKEMMEKNEERIELQTGSPSFNSKIRQSGNSPLLVVFKKCFTSKKEEPQKLFDVILKNTGKEDNVIIEGFKPQNRDNCFELLTKKQKSNCDYFVSVNKNEYEEYLFQACDVFVCVFAVGDVFALRIDKNRYGEVNDSIAIIDNPNITTEQTFSSMRNNIRNLQKYLDREKHN